MRKHSGNQQSKARLGQKKGRAPQLEHDRVNSASSDQAQVGDKSGQHPEQFEPKSKVDQIDEFWMKKCLDLARKAEKKSEVPIGCLIIGPDGKLLAQSGNLREQKQTVLGHAELACLHRAGQKLKSWRLTGCTLYVTLEPCTMCAAAIMQARIARVVFGARDPKAGAMGSVVDLSKATHMHHKIEATRGVLEGDCSILLKDFFRKRRRAKKSMRKKFQF